MTFSKLGTDTHTGQTVELSQASRREGLYIIGSTGTGKSTLISNLILEDIKQGLGVCVLDPHGDLINDVLARMQRRLEDVIFLDLASTEYVAGFNLFHCENPDDSFAAENVVSAVMHILEKVYQINRNTPQMHQYFTNITNTLIYNPQASILDIPRLLTDDAFRQGLLRNVLDDHVLWFWHEFFDNRTKIRRDDEISSTVNKLDEFFGRVLKPWFGHTKNTIPMRQIMDDRKILLVKLHARWQSMTNLIGSIIIAQLLDAAYSRSDIRVNKRKQFNVYADEFQRFASEDFATLFTEARKYGIGLTIAHQTMGQVEEKIKETCMQARNLIVFRVSSLNASELSGNFDCTPPPGEMIYEKVMEEYEETEEMEFWEPASAEQEWVNLKKKVERLPIEAWKFVDKLYSYQDYSLPDLIADHIIFARLNHDIDSIKKYYPEFLPFVDTVPKEARSLIDEFKKANHARFTLDKEDERWYTKEFKMRDENAAIACAYTYFLCRYATISIPRIPSKIQHEIALLIWEWEQLEEKRQAALRRIQYLLEHCYKKGRRKIFKGYKPTQITAIEYFHGRLDTVNHDLYQAREGRPQFTTKEMQDRITNAIAQFPNYRARVRLDGGEYVITTSKSNKGMGEQDLKKRIDDIQQRNLDKGYLRKRTDIEAEILQRQQGIQAAQMPQQPPPQRYARQVPLQEN